jgi:hypothetical protein
MGVDFSPGGARWAYSGFRRFRLRIARQLEVDLERLWHERPMIEVEPGEWRDPWREGDEPLYLLLNHSDCDGTLSAFECAVVAPRLLEVIRHWSRDDEAEDYDHEQALRLVEGMIECIRTGDPLVFH